MQVWKLIIYHIESTTVILFKITNNIFLLKRLFDVLPKCYLCIIQIAIDFKRVLQHLHLLMYRFLIYLSL